MALRGARRALAMGVIGGAASRTYDEAVLALDAANLLAHWKMNEAAGTTFTDSSGNARHLTISNVTLANVAGPTKIGGLAPVWNGTNANATLEGAAMTSYAGAFSGVTGTILVWVKLDAALLTDNADHCILNNHANANNRIGMWKIAAGNDLAVTHNGNSATAKTSTFADPTADWAFLAGVWSASGVQLFVNAVAQTAGTSLGTFTGTLARMDVGSYGASQLWYKGAMCRLSVFKSALTPEQITALYSGA